MVPEHAPVLAPQRDGGLHVLALPDREDLPAHHPRVDYPRGHPDHDDDVAQARAEHPDHRDGEQDERERELDVGQAHQEVVDPAAEVAGDEADDHAEQARDEHRGEPDHQRDARAEDDAGEDVAPEVIGAERMQAPLLVLPARLLEALADVLLERIERRHERREHRGQHHRQHHRGAEERGAPPRQAVQEGDPLALAGRARGRHRHRGDGQRAGRDAGHQRKRMRGSR